MIFPKLWCAIRRGPTTFSLRGILQKHDNSRATSNKMMYKTTDSQDIKFQRENRLVNWVCHWNYYTNSNKQSITNLCHCDACDWGFSDNVVPLTIPICQWQKSETVVRCFVCHSISVLGLTCFMEENVLWHSDTRMCFQTSSTFTARNLSVWEIYLC